MQAHHLPTRLIALDALFARSDPLARKAGERRQPRHRTFYRHLQERNETHPALEYPSRLAGVAGA